MADLSDLLARRRMCRSFRAEPLSQDRMDRVLAAATRAPSAGNSDGLDLLVLSGPDETSRYWDVTLPAERRAGFRWPGLLRAPLLVIPIADPTAYVDRYREPDKAGTGLGAGPAAWSVPYWTVDASFAAMLIQLAALDEGLGVLFFGLFDHAPALMAALGVPEGRQPIGALAIGVPDGADAPGRSARRPRRDLDAIVHRGRW
jgi:nitroreductase